MSLLRSSFALTRAFVPRTVYVRSFAENKDNSDIQQLLVASRNGNLEEAEKIAATLPPSRQVTAALAAVNLQEFNYEKAQELLETAKKQ